MEEKLNILYKECVEELKNIGIDVLNKEIVGNIEIHLSKRNNKRYGCCKQEEPDQKSKYIEKNGRRKILRYAKFNKHVIEISPWVMELEDEIIKNTIVHEIIHCMPFCNNHGEMFKKYAQYINTKLGYNISRVGNKVEDYKRSNKTYEEDKNYKYKIKCQNCGQEIYRKRFNKKLLYKYRCGKCNGRLKLEEVY